MHIDLFKKYYFISKFDTNNINKQNRKTIIIYRDDNVKNQNEELINKISKFCKKSSLKFYLSNNIKLAIKLNLDGVYISAFNNKFEHLAYSLKKNFKIIGAAHNLKEIRIKEIQGAESIFISPIFKRKNNISQIGIVKLNYYTRLTKKAVIALGGINNKNIKLLKMTKSNGFAAISYFENI